MNDGSNRKILSFIIFLIVVQFIQIFCRDYPCRQSNYRNPENRREHGDNPPCRRNRVDVPIANFWNKNVISGILPDPDGSGIYDDILEQSTILSKYPIVKHHGAMVPDVSET